MLANFDNLQHQRRERARSLFELCPNLVDVIKISLFALMKVLYIVPKRVHLIQSKLYFSWTAHAPSDTRRLEGRRAGRGDGDKKTGVDRDNFFLSYSLPQGPVGGEEATAPLIRAGQRRRIREWRTDVFECRVGLVRFCSGIASRLAKQLIYSGLRVRMFGEGVDGIVLHIATNRTEQSRTEKTSTVKGVR
jgi:hypothetical protein